MNRIKQLTILAAVVIGLGAMFPIYGENAPRDEKAIEVAAVPEALQRTVRQTIPGIRFTGAETEMYHGEKVFELRGYANNRWHEILISSNGQVLRREVSDEDDDWEGADIELSQVPAIVKTAATRAIPGFVPDDAETASGIYELEGRAGEYLYEIKVADDGYILQINKEKRSLFHRIWTSVF